MFDILERTTSLYDRSTVLKLRTKPKMIRNALISAEANCHVPVTKLDDS